VRSCFVRVYVAPLFTVCKRGAVPGSGPVAHESGRASGQGFWLYPGESPSRWFPAARSRGVPLVPSPSHSLITAWRLPSCVRSTFLGSVIVRGALTCFTQAPIGASKGALLSYASVSRYVRSHSRNRWAPSDLAVQHLAAHGEAALVISHGYHPHRRRQDTVFMVRCRQGPACAVFCCRLQCVCVCVALGSCR